MCVNDKKKTLYESLGSGPHKRAHNCGKHLRTFMIREKKVGNVLLQQSSVD